jgi:hypothetical protein
MSFIYFCSCENLKLEIVWFPNSVPTTQLEVWTLSYENALSFSWKIAFLLSEKYSQFSSAFFSFFKIERLDVPTLVTSNHRVCLFQMEQYPYGYFIFVLLGIRSWKKCGSLILQTWSSILKGTLNHFEPTHLFRIPLLIFSLYTFVKQRRWIWIGDWITRETPRLIRSWDCIGYGAIGSQDDDPSCFG